MLINGWDFPVSMTGSVDRGHRVDLTLRIPGLLDSNESNRLMLIVSSFFELSGLGAFCGNRMMPEDCRMQAAWKGCPNMVPGVLHWRFEELSMDFKAWSILFNMIQATEIPIDLIEVKSQGPDHLGTLNPESRCLRHESVPAQFVDAAPFREIRLEMSKDLDTVLMESIADSLVSWALICGLGGFPLTDSELPHLVYPALPTVSPNNIRFVIEERSLHASAYAVLDNFVAYLRAKNVPIHTYEIAVINGDDFVVDR